MIALLQFHRVNVAKKMRAINLIYMTANNASPLVADEAWGTVLITIKMLLVKSCF